MKLTREHLDVLERLSAHTCSVDAALDGWDEPLDIDMIAAHYAYELVLPAHRVAATLHAYLDEDTVTPG